jgi:hypothetical protein
MEPGTINKQLFNLKETAERLGVSIETLILWNENNILKPTITRTGEVGYRDEQINQFLAIQQQPLKKAEINVKPVYRSFYANSFLVFVLSCSATVFSLTAVLKSLPNEKGGQEVISSARTSLLDPSGSTFISLPAQTNNISESTKVIPQLSNNFYSDTAYFAPNKDTPNTGVLAAATTANGSMPVSVSTKQNVDLNLILVISAMGLLVFPFVFKKQPVYSANLDYGFDKQTISSPIVEVNQKTDGSVVLCFQGQEYKVSKPELDSESDQFIERLMGLAGPGVKEIDYDAVTDGEIKLSAPLSKIVTRLGFVGIKRDLFFPRTSKNRVLFRRYLTQDDLSSMNLSPEQIKNEFAA